MLIINNPEIAKLLSMADAIEALDAAYRQLVSAEAVCRPRIDIQIPTKQPGKVYQWSSVEGGSTSGYFGLRVKSDIIYEQEYAGARTQEKYCVQPGTFCGLIFLTDVHSGEPLALLNDGFIQLLRVGADGGIGLRYLAKENAEVVGMLGSGGMARTHMEAFLHVRPTLKRLQVYSPTPANREAFGAEMAEKYGLEVKVCDRPEEIYRGADIVAALTDSAVAVLDGPLIEKGAHIVAPGTGHGIKERNVLERIDLYLRFGNATTPWGAEKADDDEYFTYAARPDLNTGLKRKKPGRRSHGALFPPERTLTFADIVAGQGRVRTSDDQISFSERGNLQGNEFWPLAARAYELAKAQGLGHHVPTEWLLQDIRD